LEKVKGSLGGAEKTRHTSVSFSPRLLLDLLNKLDFITHQWLAIWIS